MYKSQKLLKKTASLLLAFTFIMPAVPSFARDFKDVPSSYWGKPYIDNMSNVEIINGYPDGTFKPEKSLTHLESFILISGLIKPDNTEKSVANAKYKYLLNELKIPWGIEHVAICLNRGVISETELRNIHKLGLLNKPAKREDVAVYIAKGMGFEDKANEKQKVGAPLLFEDSEFIKMDKRKYVSVLVSLDIIKGDNKNKFNPNNNVKRSEIATMLSKSYDYKIKNPVTPTEPTVPMDSLEIKEGTINSILDGGQSPFIMVLDKYGDKVAYSINKATSKIYVDGKTSDLNGLAVGQEVEIKTKKGDRVIVSINAESVEEKYKGKIECLYPSTYKLTLEYEKDKKTYTKEFDVDKNVKVYLDEEVVYLKELKEGDTVELKSKNNKVYDIDAESKMKKIEGVLQDIKKDGTEYYLTVVDSKDKPHRYLVSSKAYITRNKSKAKVEDLKLKDSIYMEVEYDEIVDIDARVVKRKIKGQVSSVSVRLSKSTEISVFNMDTKKEEIFVLAKDAYIRIDNKSTSSYDIKPGYYVEMAIEGDEIIEIYADSKSGQISIKGKIEYINYNKETITIVSTGLKFEDDLYGEEITIYLEHDAIIADSRLEKLYFKELRKGDIITVSGSYDGSTLITNRIILEK